MPTAKMVGFSAAPPLLAKLVNISGTQYVECEWSARGGRSRLLARACLATDRCWPLAPHAAVHNNASDRAAAAFFTYQDVAEARLPWLPRTPA